MKNLCKVCTMAVFLLPFGLTVQGQPTTGTWISDTDFAPGEWMELLFGGGEGQPGNEIRAFNGADYNFDSAMIGMDPDDVILRQECLDPESPLPFMYRTFYYGGILGLNNGGSPWASADTAGSFVASMGPVTNLTTKYVGDENCDPNGDISFQLTAVGMFDDYPDYYAHIEAHYDGSPTLDEGASPPTLSDLLDWAKISISPPTPVDVKPGSCKNPVNVKSRGVIPVVVMGTELLDVTTIDPSTILLEGVPALRWALEDVGGPYEPEPEVEEPECSDAEIPDGYMDLVLKFSTQAVLAAIGPVEDGDMIVVTLTADAEDYPVLGQDVITILKKGRIHVRDDDGEERHDNGNHYGWTNGNGNAYGRNKDVAPSLQRDRSRDHRQDGENNQHGEEEAGNNGNANGKDKDKENGNGSGKDKENGNNNGKENGSDNGNGKKNGHNKGGD